MSKLTRTKETPTVLTLDEVAQILRIGRVSAYQAIARGEIPSVRVGKRILVPRFAFAQMLNPGSTAKAALDSLSAR
jgi:excisionase family DNA binding protein